MPPDKKNVIDVRPSILPQLQSHFSWLRTRLSVERTLMSWVRTATAMIGFGFTIFQFFDHLREMTGVAPAKHPLILRVIPLCLIALGTLALIVAIHDYRKLIAYLWSDEFKDIAGIGDQPATTSALVVAILLAVVGVVTLGILVSRL
jgi:putative membrane protein